MTSLTLSIPEQIKRRMREFRYINWSEVAREAIIDKVQLLRKMDALLSKSSLTQADTIRYGRLIKKRQWRATKKIVK